MKRIILYSTLALLIFFLFACKKEKKDSTPPQVSISSPAGGQAFKMFDTITVSAHVSDETQLTSVVVSLNDLNNVPVQSSVSIGIQSKDFTFSIKYILTQYHLSSGFYNISVSANDGSNLRQGTVQVYINESPTVKTGYFIVGNTQPKNIVHYDLSFNQTNNIVLNTGFNGMAYGGYYQQLYVNGNINQSFQAYSTQSNSPVWSLTYSGGGLPQYMNVYTDGTKPYISYYAGNVVSYSNTGSISKTYVNSNNAYYASYFTFGSVYDIGLFKNKFGSGTDELICFGNSTGVAINNNFSPLASVVGIFEHTSDQFYVLGNDASNNAVFSLYTVSSNVCTPMSFLIAGKMLSAVQIDSDNLVFSSSNGNIYAFKYSTSNLTPLASVTAQQLFYQSKMKELTAACKNNLYVYSVSASYMLTQQTMQAFADSIIGFEVITNK